MIRCNLSVLMGQRKVRVVEVARACGLNRSTVSSLYFERARRIDFDTVEKLCRYFQCEVGDLLAVTDTDQPC
jgi:putative transcriptional regulator